MSKINEEYIFFNAGKPTYGNVNYYYYYYYYCFMIDMIGRKIEKFPAIKANPSSMN